MSADLSILPRQPAMPSGSVHYYVIVERKRFGSVAAMCRFVKVQPDDVASYFDNARLHRSDAVVIDTLALGNPDDNIRAVVIHRPGGAVILCGGLFAEMNEDLSVVETLAKQFSEHPDNVGKFVGIGEFRASAGRGVMQ